ncbi:MAG: peptide deformylase [Acidimicrobiales bacterium]
MAVRPIRVFGDPVLRTRCRPVADFDRALRRLVGDLCETLADAGGAGLAAPQIGANLRVFAFVVTDPTVPEFGTMGHIVNPVLVEKSAEALTDLEGCLSLPGLEYELARSTRVVADGFDVHGEPLRVAGTERLARCLAHETDHLDGVLFIDRLGPEERRRAMHRVRELVLAGADVQVKRSPHAGRTA